MNKQATKPDKWVSVSDSLLLALLSLSVCQIFMIEFRQSVPLLFPSYRHNFKRIPKVEKRINVKSYSIDCCSAWALVEKLKLWSTVTLMCTVPMFRLWNINNLRKLPHNCHTILLSYLIVNHKKNICIYFNKKVFCSVFLLFTCNSVWNSWKSMSMRKCLRQFTYYARTYACVCVCK